MKVKVFGKMTPKKILISILVVVTVIAIYFLDSLLVIKEKPKEEKEITETVTVAEKTEIAEAPIPALKEEAKFAEKRERRDPFVKSKELVDMENKIKSLMAENAKPKKAKPVEKAKEVEAVTKEEPDKFEKLEAEIAELREEIWRLLTQAPIQVPEDKEKINWQVAQLNQKVAILESQLYQKPEVVEYHHYYRTWPYFYPYARLYFLSMLPHYPYLGGAYWYVGWYNQYCYPFYSPYYGGYYSSDYYPSTYYRGQTTIHRNQLTNRRSIQNYPPRKQLSSSSLKKQPKIAGKYDSPWGPLNSPKTTSRSKISSSTASQRISGLTKIRSSSSLRSVGTSRRTATKTKVRKK